MAGVFDIMAGGQSGSGWARAGAALGQAMSGGPQQTYDDTMLRGHRVQRALMDAKKATMQYNELARLEDNLREALPPEQHHLVGYITGAQRAGVNPTQGLQASREGVRNMAINEAYSRAMAGDTEGMNPMLAVAQQQPLRHAQVAGNVLFNPNVAPESQTPQLTEYGRGQLTNQGERTRGLNAASMASAMRSGGRSGSSAEPGSLEEQAEAQREKMLDDAARAIWRDARLDDRDMYGLTEKDIRYSLETRGEAYDRDGNLLGTFDVTPESLLNPPADFSSVQGAVGGSTASPASAMSGAPVTEPRGAARAPVSGVSDEGSQLPPQARAQLKEGVHTTFANGQVWTLSQGVPVQVF